MPQPHNGVDEEGQALFSEMKRIDSALSGIWAEPKWAALRPARAPISNLGRHVVRTAIVARRSYGKSTLFNALIGRPLLYSSWRQASSYPIYLGAGNSDLAEAIYEDGRHVRVPVTAEAIKAATAQFSSGRTVNPATIGAERLSIALADWPLAANMQLIDLAGFDDSYHSAGETEKEPGKEEDAVLRRRERARALRAAALADADAVLFVLRPTVFLGQLERQILRDIYDAKGPAGVVPVFNIEVYEEGEEDAETLMRRSKGAFVHQNVSDARLMYAKFLEEIGIDADAAWSPVAVAAKPALERPEVGDFGLTALRATLGAIAGGDRSVIWTARRFAAGRGLRETCELLSQILTDRNAHEEALAENEAISRHNAEQAGEWRRYLKDEAEAIAEALCGAFNARAVPAFEVWCKTPGSWWETVSRLNVALDAAAEEAAAELVEHVPEFYKGQFSDRGSGVDPGLFRGLQRVCAPRTHTVLPHEPDLGVWEHMFGLSEEKRSAGWKSFTDDVDWEINASFRHWRERADDIYQVLRTHLPEPERVQMRDVPPCETKIPADEIKAIFGKLLTAISWPQPDFQQGFARDQQSTASHAAA